MNDIRTLVGSEPYWNEDYEGIVQLPYNHLAQQPGKNFRTKLINTFNIYYGIDKVRLEQLSELISILHTSSLLIDDIEDNSETRRGIQTSHLKYGTPMTINSANYMYFKAMAVLERIASVRVDGSTEKEENVDGSLLKDLLVIFNAELINLHRGQGLDIYWRDSFPSIIPTESMYFNMVMNKTGGLFRLAVRIMERLKDETDSDSKSLVPLANLIGILFQVRDDYQNLTDETMIKNKGFAEDLSEGKLSFPVIHGLRYALDNEDEGTILFHTIKAKPKELKPKKETIDYLRDVTKSLEYTELKIKEISDLILDPEFVPDNNQEFNTHIISIVKNLSEI
ncbi:hypothetical protein TPHA_0I01940 [Tetrapisispora phaffii CBS 4417]|uniref:Geranylgeranyl pyrophosphate synthase n=1 Tax=Tetrapisispora phaffii (strain ATCC 24235 / CBS 4417 / NBRC 1672 / NRRL Y-8282 / UCD 70-5) TaxID=1071381 RepID=G8BXS0_TETPH|nr:hypothetical protein TPHA_0I01940 [Tetrapisispora phaffii CBS 4417]CCE64698.1 hypothetical protein TPHA_0I01940 [Tetrapisispora phaffii CBS 4417]